MTFPYRDLGSPEDILEVQWAERTNEPDVVNHPPHYTAHPSGVECIQITEHMGFCLGNAFKYIWRADLKHDAIEDMRKAIWYIEREIARRADVTYVSAEVWDDINSDD